MDARLALASRFCLVVTGLGALAAQEWRPMDGWKVTGTGAFDAARGRIVTVDGNGNTHEWNQQRWLLRPLPPLPPAVFALTFDPARGRTVVLTGQNSSPFRVAEYDGASWRTLPATGPTSRSGAAYAFDTTRNRLVMFGGYSSETWEWDGTAWHGPVYGGGSAHNGAAMAFDSARGCVVRFGGQTSMQVRSSETSEWNGTTWSSRSPATRPSARIYHAMAYDARRQRVVLFGTGFSGPGETWEYDGSSWTQAGGTQPPSRPNPILVYDSARQRIALFGPAIADGLWEWDGVAWTHTPVPEQPGGLAIAHSVVRDRTVVLTAGKTWEWDGRSWLASQPVTSPGWRYQHSSWSDRTDVFVFGGGNQAGGSLSDTWRWDGTTWTQISPATAPPARRYTVVAGDPAGGAVLFGGRNSAGTVLGDTWVLRNNQWTQLNVSPAPPPRFRAAMATDWVRGRVILFGGDDNTSRFNDTWEWDGTVWQATNPVLRPPANAPVAMASDATSGLTYLMLGTGFNDYRMQTWTWDGANWQQVMVPSIVPMIYDGVSATGIPGGVRYFDGNLIELTAQSAHVRAYGAGCGAVAPRLTADLWPRAGESDFAFSTLGHVPQAGVAIVLAAAAGNTPLLGCDLLVDPAAFFVLTVQNQAGFGVLPLPIPADPTLVGQSLFAQGWSLSPSALQATAGLQLVIGR